MTESGVQNDLAKKVTEKEELFTPFRLHTLASYK